MMKIIIVGAGIAGLSTAIALAKSGHDVTVLEAAPELAELGAGVQMTPQAIRYLFEWGLKDDIIAESLIPETFFIKDYKSGQLLASIPTGDMDNRYGAPYVVVHRATLHAILHKHAVSAGSNIILNYRVAQYNFENGSVTSATGDTYEGDLVIAADGINSFARKQFLGDKDPGAKPTGWAAIRMMAAVSTLKADPITADLVNLETHSSNLWIGAGSSCMTYQIKDATMLNIVLSHKDDVDMFKFTPAQYQRTMKEITKDYEEPVKRLLGWIIPRMQNYPVYAVEPLSRWTHGSGRFTLIGDAAHAMAFYLSMGVSLAVEDAAALVAAINNTKDQSDISERQRALAAFEKVRKERSSLIQAASLHAGNTAHLEEGQKREEMYENLKRDGAPNKSTADPHVFLETASYGLGDEAVRDWCYDYDAVKPVLEAMNSPSLQQE